MANAARKRSRWAGSDAARTLTKMEGLLQSLRDTPPEHRPEQLVQVYLANQFGVSARTMTLRLADAESRRLRDNGADHFAELWQQIGNVIGERTAAAIFKAAHDVGNRNSFPASKWLLERLDPDTYGTERARALTHDSGSIVSDVPQEVWDEMDTAESEQLDQIEAMVNSELVKLEALVRRVQKRIADKRVNEDPEDD